MSELIRREDVRREIQASFDGGAFRWQDGQDLMDRINALPTASPWHRVEEKPKEADQYFVIWENNGDRGGGAAWFSLRLGWIWGGPKITHWMPIEPPKEDA